MLLSNGYWSTVQFFEPTTMKVDIFFSVLVMRIRTQNFDIEDKTPTRLQVHAKPISIHAPMTRLLSGLSLFLEKFDLDFSTSHEFDILEKPSVVELMEPSLRSAVLVAQVHAGMWRRNGYALIDQVTGEPLSPFWLALRTLPDVSAGHHELVDIWNSRCCHVFFYPN